MRGLLIAALCAAMLFALIGCGDNADTVASCTQSSGITQRSEQSAESKTENSAESDTEGSTEGTHPKWCRVYTEGEAVYIETELFGDDVCGRIAHKRIPLIQMLNALGAISERVSDTVTSFNLYGEEYILDTERENLFDSQGEEMLLVAPGSSHRHFVVEGEEVFVDNSLLMHLFMSLEIDASYSTSENGYELVKLEKN